MIVEKMLQEEIIEEVKKQPLPDVFAIYNEVEMEDIDGNKVMVKQPIGNFSLQQLEMDANICNQNIAMETSKLKEIQEKIDMIKSIK